MSTINLRRENGKRLTIQGRGAINNPSLQCVQSILWRKNGSPLQTLEMTLDEAEQLGTAIFAAIYDAKSTSAPAEQAAPKAEPLTREDAKKMVARFGNAAIALDKGEGTISGFVQLSNELIDALATPSTDSGRAKGED
ncbi:hypothetical protein C7T35_01165 [Variovorax sp. WS11]|uniref:hypothetical protein n=1 Tax=Variovorax sp. WS11 TaxID=1105204 RepID=UPI000D0D78E7|nr:hypothetical protein [Variovorax sp. WS11]NDZ11542.1 hypothetical protein [Variovorax sp. WS11]PSL86606.1 hypothetical protein C7T35_01165 [Variovorax sp. WS11]